MTPERIHELYNRFRKGDRSPEAMQANAIFARNARAAKRAAARAHHAGDVGRTRPAHLRTIAREVELAADDTRVDTEVETLRRLCDARARLSRAIDDYVARCFDAGHKPFGVGIVMDRPPL